MRLLYLLLVIVILFGNTILDAQSEDYTIKLNSCGCNIKEVYTEKCTELCNNALQSRNHHDPCIILQKIGNKNSIPLLIDVLNKYTPIEVDGKKAYECTVGHCLDALESLTGLQFAKEQWETWWLKEGINWPSEKFYSRSIENANKANSADVKSHVAD